ncbi:MAG: T9SS type A sorting domain-containing protein [Bacteroidetes bacterium]|nr:T9SS type A sorting domain-containing protein [Bacteroidota bacterium]
MRATQVALEEQHKHTDFIVYPNPTNDMFAVEFAGHGFTGTIIVWDATGRELIKTKAHSEVNAVSMSLHHLAPGMYQLGVQKEDGGFLVKNMVKN